MRILLFCLIIIGMLSFTEQWGTQLDEAKAKARKENKSILLIFTGSDWDKKSEKFKTDILSSSDFKTYTSKSLELVVVDFPRLNKNKLSQDQVSHNNIVLEKYNSTRKIPYLLLLDETGKIIDVLDINFTTNVFVNQIKQRIDQAKQ